MNNLVALSPSPHMPALAVVSGDCAKQKLIEHGIHLS
ncbi:MAG: hypothetical protein JWQ49_6704 [Edaphobacter sp.]|nr:hypothetical protein [Edaphobacter sp.]